MPYNKLSLAEMTAESEEYVDIGNIAERLGVHNRTVERLIEEYRKKLKRWRRRGRTKEYLWSDVLHYAKIHTGIEHENTPSISIRGAYTRRRVKELETKIERMERDAAANEFG